MKWNLFYCLVAIMFTASVQANPIAYIGEKIILSQHDFTEVKRLFKRQNGVDKFAVVAYDVELINYNDVGLPKMNFEVWGDITARWYSSNFAMKVSIYCDNTLISDDFDYGMRLNNTSYIVKPNIRKMKHPIPDGCGMVKLRLEKVGSLSRKFYTKITDISIRVFLTNDNIY